MPSFFFVPVYFSCSILQYMNIALYHPLESNLRNALYVTFPAVYSFMRYNFHLFVRNNFIEFVSQIKLADKQAELERLGWEAMMSNKKVEELQGEVVTTDLEITALMQIFEQLSKHSSAAYPDDRRKTTFHYFEQLQPVVNSSNTFPFQMRTVYVTRYML